MSFTDWLREHALAVTDDEINRFAVEDLLPVTKGEEVIGVLGQEHRWIKQVCVYANELESGERLMRFVRGGNPNIPQMPSTLEFVLTRNLLLIEILFALHCSIDKAEGIGIREGWKVIKAPLG